MNNQRWSGLSVTLIVLLQLPGLAVVLYPMRRLFFDEHGSWVGSRRGRQAVTR